MKKNQVFHFAAAILAFLPGVGLAGDLGTAFTYQGSLENGSGPVTDTCDFRFGLWDEPGGGNQKGNSPQTKTGVAVTNGVFVIGDLDFGSAGAINGTARWLAIEVQCPGDPGFTLLSPRVRLSPVPHALALPGLYTQENGNSHNIIGGWIQNSVEPGVIGATINGGGLLNFWQVITDNFGTIGGGLANRAGNLSGTTDDALAATVSGGYFNRASGLHSSVGGGQDNHASGDDSTVSGGGFNNAAGLGSTVPGGRFNDANAQFSFAAGVLAKANHLGTFVWSDGFGGDFASTGQAQFLIRASGGVGIGTNAPNKQLTVDGDMEVGINNVDYHHLRIGGGNSSGFLYGSFPAYGDGIHMGYNHYANAGGAHIIPNAGGETSRISTGYGYISLATGGVNSAPTNRVFVDSVGRVGIGTVGPAKTLHIGDTNIPNSEGMIRLASRSGNSGEQRIWDVGVPETDADLSGTGYSFVIDDTLLGSAPEFVVQYGTGRVGIGDTTPEVALDVVGDINYTGVILDVSDERLKENIAPVQNALAKLQQLRGVYFTMKDTPEQRDVGLIAQDVQAVLPEAVRVVEPDGGYLGVSYPSLIGLLVEAIKEVEAESREDHPWIAVTDSIRELERLVQDKDSEIERLKVQNADLEARLQRLEKTLLASQMKNGGGQ